MRRTARRQGFRPARAATLLLASLLFFSCGCASTSSAPASARYREGAGETVYESSSMNLGTLFKSGGMSREPSVRLQGWATCDGRNCRPQQAWLSFTLHSNGSGGRSNVLSSRDVVIRTDSDVHRWPDDRPRFGENPQNVQSELTRIRMELGALRDIAESENVRGQLGGQSFSLSYEDRAPLRALVERMQNPEGKGPELGRAG